MTMATRATTLDPITIEVIENRLTEIGWEGGITLQRTAASPSVVEAKDMGFNVADHQGRTIVYSTWMPRHGTNLAFMLRACRQRFASEEIFPGDVFLNNNPHDGALHNLVLAVFAPVFAGDELVAWTGCASHHPDIGGITPGRSPEATTWFQEGLIFRPIKLVERGRFRQDIFDFFLDNVRMPRYQGIDLKAQ
ncbi:MAG: hydantoinase B/oxoprolinase family protein, partial [Chloroflexi bacterium]|nr:hydantoinase B/oxoprolinase family protein [Chloroflexota bacterium]